jgi:hypothetical protein
VRSRSLALALSLVACATGHPPKANEAGPGIVFPAEFAESKGASETTTTAAPRKPKPKPAPSEPPKGSAPDPEPLRQADQYEYEVVYDRGTLRVASVRRVTYPNPVVTARRMGRYAIELWIGQELIDRVRFDFPLTAADEPPPSGPEPLSAPRANLGEGVVTSQKLLIPAAERARRAVLVDRATNARTELPWPPDRSAGKPAAEAAPNVTDGGS